MINLTEKTTILNRGLGDAVPGPCTNREAATDKPLAAELELLQDSLWYAHKALKRGDEDIAKAGTLVARLSDSVAKMLLAQQKLLTEPDHASAIEAEFDETLRAMGLGE